MTRREEIVRKAMNSYPDCPERGFETGYYEYPEFHDDEREAFIEGAEWADKTMIDKACEWVEKHIFDFPWYDNESGDFSSKDIANALRKTMEE